MIVPFSRLVSSRAALTTAPRAFAASGVAGKLFSAKVKHEEHLEEHWTYPISYPTPEELERQSFERKKCREEERKMLMSKEAYDEHHGPGSPTAEDVERLMAEITKLEEEHKKNIAKVEHKEHFEEHWTYPVSYPTPEELERQSLEGKKCREDERKRLMSEEAYDEHHGPGSPTPEDLERQMEKILKLKEEHKNMIVQEGMHNEHWSYPVSYPTPEALKRQTEEMKKYKEEQEKLQTQQKLQKEKEADIRHHAWE